VTYPNGDRSTYVMIAFECAVRGGTLHQQSDETTDAAYVGKDELRSLRTSPWVRHVLPALHDRPRAARFAPAAWRPPSA
jgi:hypothetical protein